MTCLPPLSVAVAVQDDEVTTVTKESNPGHKILTPRLDVMVFEVGGCCSCCGCCCAVDVVVVVIIVVAAVVVVLSRCLRSCFDVVHLFLG